MKIPKGAKQHSADSKASLLSSSITFVDFSQKPVYPTMVKKNFRCSDYWKMHFQLTHLAFFEHLFPSAEMEI